MAVGKSVGEAGKQSKAAVIWDFDGTLVDTRLKNLQVTRAIISAVSGRAAETIPALASVEAYAAADRRRANWRELYGREFGLSDSQADEAGRLWTTYQLQDRTPASFFPGMSATLEQLDGTPQAIFSQNSRKAIERTLAQAGLEHCFSLVVGYEEVGFWRQKPAPDGLLFCLAELGIDEGEVLFVGDHETDIECARRANRALIENGEAVTVVAVAAEFGGHGGTVWSTAPDYVVGRPAEVVGLVRGDGLD